MFHCTEWCRNKLITACNSPILNNKQMAAVNESSFFSSKVPGKRCFYLFEEATSIYMERVYTHSFPLVTVNFLLWFWVECETLLVIDSLYQEVVGKWYRGMHLGASVSLLLVSLTQKQNCAISRVSCRAPWPPGQNCLCCKTREVTHERRVLKACFLSCIFSLGKI